VCIGLILVALVLSRWPLEAQGPARFALAEEPLEPLPAGVMVETVADGLKWPIALAFAPDGRLFFTEKGGHGGEKPAHIWIIEDDRVRPQPFATLQVATLNERGLLGIAIDPKFEDNGYVYAFYTQLNPLSNRVVRFREENGVGVEPTIILEVPYVVPDDRATDRHNGGNIHFGPDGKLYVTIGDNHVSAYAQDLDVLPGKILRLNRDGSAPEDNPFYTTAEAPRSKVYAYGLRNSFDFTFDPLSGALFATENGDQCNDELNRIVAGGNYGWPLTAPCEAAPPGTVPPLRTYTPPIVPTGIVVYDGELIPEWRGDLFFCSFLMGTLRRATLNAARDAIVSVTRIDITQKCQIDVAVGPDGALYFTSWNGFGPGSIYRIGRVTLSV
jgi:glucose/arabinose dehydrogenase